MSHELSADDLRFAAQMAVDADAATYAPVYLAPTDDTLPTVPPALARAVGPSFLADTWDETDEQILPEWIPVEGGMPLLYPGESHYLYGPGGAGKSWIVYYCAKAVAAAGGVSLLLDYESNPRTVRTRLKLMGVTREQASRIAYWRVSGSLRPTDAAGGVLGMWTAEHKPALVVLDSVARALGAMGLDENKPSDFQAFHGAVVAPLEQARIASLLIDHTGHVGDRTGIPMPRGASNKLDCLSGAMYFLRTVKPWDRTTSGSAELVTLKDREGCRKWGDVAAVVTVTVTPADEDADVPASVELAFGAGDAADADDEPKLPRFQMAKASAFLATYPDKGFAISVLRAPAGKGGAGLNNNSAAAALAHLVNFGYVLKTGGQYSHLRVFWVNDELPVERVEVEEF